MAAFGILGSVFLPDNQNRVGSVHASLRQASTDPIFVAAPTPPVPIPVTGPQIVIASSFTCTVSYGGNSW